MLKRLISTILIITMSLTVLPTNVQAAVSDEMKNIVENTSETFDVPQLPAGANPPDGGYTFPDEMLSDEDLSETFSSETSPSEELVPAETEIANSDTLDNDFASAFAENSVTYTVADDGAYLTFDIATGTVTRFTAGSDANANYNIVIPSFIENIHVTKIGASCFDINSSEGMRINSVVISEGITEIENRAFEGLSQVVSITLPQSLQKIGFEAFRACTQLASIEIPYGVTAIERYTFEACKSLVEIDIPDSVTSIGTSAFRECTSLVRVKLPSRLDSIEESAFGNCNMLSDVVMPVSCPTINSETYNEYGAFNGCSSLTSITLPEDLVHIGKGTFEKTGLVSINIPDSVTSIGDDAFASCVDLNNVKLPQNGVDLGARVFLNCTSLKSIVIPSGTLSIPTASFEGCSSLKSVSLPEGITAIDDYAFFKCSLLSEVNFPRTVKSIGNNAFYETALSGALILPEDLETIGTYAFNHCENISDIQFPHSLNSIGPYAFQGVANVKSVELYDGLTTVDFFAFAGMKNLESAYLPDTVTSLGYNVFGGCTSLMDVHIPAHITVIPDGLFYNCQSLASVELPAEITAINGSYMGGAFEKCSSLQEIVIPDSVTIIGESAFEDCTSLEYIRNSSGENGFPRGVTVMSPSVLKGCTSLKEFIIPDTVETIESFAFQNCSSLEEIILPSSVKTIVGGDGYHSGENFEGCTSLKKVVLSENLEEIASMAFYGCPISSISIPKSVKDIYGGAFTDLKYALIWNPDMVFHAFPLQNNPLIYGYVGSTAETFCEQRGLEFRDILLYDTGRIITVSVTTPIGTSLADVSFRWYDDTGKLLEETSAVLFAEKDKKYSFEITLPKGSTNIVYKNPGRIIVGEDETDISLVLEQYEMLTMTGIIVDTAGRSINNANITVTYPEGSVSSMPYGSIKLSNVPKTGVAVTVFKDGYYTFRAYYDLTSVEGSSYDLGEIVLSETVKDRITVNLSVNKAVSNDETAYVETLSGLNGFDIHVYRESGSEITNFEIQGANIVFRPNVVKANEVLRITISDISGKYTATDDIYVTLDSDKMAVADYTVTEKGSFVVENPSTSNYRVILFGHDGKLVFSALSQPGERYAPLEAGNYTVVIIKKNNLLYSVPTLAYLDSTGLKSGSDYYRANISIRDGVIEKLSNVTVPNLDESKFSYTIPGSTSLSLYGTNSPAQGMMFMLCGKYSVDTSKRMTPASIRIVLPEGIEPTNTKVAVINEHTVGYSYNSETRTISFDCKELNCEFYIYALATQVGNYDISAYINYQSGAIQPIGTAIANVESANISVLELTGSKVIPVSGKTLPNSNIVIYDGGTKIGETRANSVGSWNIDVTLAEPTYTFSYHFITAKITSNYSSTFETDPVLVTYNENAPILQTLTMYGDGSKLVVIDYTTSERKVKYYTIARATDTYTFVLKFNNNEGLSDVYAVFETELGETKYVETVFDEETQSWVGSVVSKYRPVDIYAVYNCGYLNNVIDDEAAADIEKELSQMASAIQDSFENIPEDTYTVENFNSETGYGDFVYNNPETGKKEKVGIYVYKHSKIDDSITAQQLEESGYIPFESNGHIIYSSVGADIEGSIYCNYIDLEERQQTTVSLDLSERVQQSAGNPTGPSFDPALASDISSLIGVISSLIPGVLGDVLSIGSNTSGTSFSLADLDNLKNGILGDKDSLNGYYQDVIKLIETRCSDGSRQLPDEYYNKVKDELSNIKLDIDAFCKGLIDDVNRTEAFIKGSFGVGLISQAASELHPVIIAASADWTILSWYVVTLSKSRIVTNRNLGYSDMFSKIAGKGVEIKNHLKECDGDLAPALPGSIEGQHNPVTPHLIDPAGYVYEAVPSNRLEGVTTVISSQAGGIWNAEDYDQINPQITGKDGSYQWFVPEGNWKVSFTKEGYENADTSLAPQTVNGWLPVPPPQLGINVGMISKASPVVENVVVYTDGAEIKFSQYMDIESVRSAISLASDGSSVSVTVEPMDAEFNEEGTVQYASRFKAIPLSGKISAKSSVSVAVSAKNYAGKPISSKFTSKEMIPVQKPEKIVVSSRIPVLFHGSAAVEVTLLPSISGMTLLVETLSPDLVGISAQTVITDDDGRATFDVEGKLLGSGVVRITEPESGLIKEIEIAISLEASPDPVTATFEDGTVLKSGTKLNEGDKIYLSTPTNGAVIRYTLDDTCPCEESALTYNGPIEYKAGTTVIRAAAYKDGKYSATIRIELASEYLLGDADGNGKITLDDAILTLKYAMGVDLGKVVFIETAADVNGSDGKITLNDAVDILRLAMGVEN